MSYTLAEWTTFCETALDRFSVVDLPVTQEARDKAIPGSTKHCTIANAVAGFTGMNAATHNIAVDAEHIKFVLGNTRYALYHEVVGAEHIKCLDALGKSENAASAAEFKPFVLKLRAGSKKPIHTRERIQEPLMAPKLEAAAPKPELVAQVLEKNGNADTRAVSPTATRKARVKKSRWAL